MSDRPLSAEEIKAMNPDERIKLLYELKLELARLRSQAKMGILTNVGRIKIVKKNIARLMTAVNEELRKVQSSA
jgi:large subunit ribosomal protein L29|uniref:Large ribosomal subunit protein uL29 n=1 Tax=Ignisphaera aggregans TaxID=334771 RepID=A0A7J2U196_9CREN